MEVILFSPEKNGLEQRVIDAVTQAGLRDQTETFSTVESLSARFLKPKDSMAVVIVIAPTKDRSGQLDSLRELLMGIRVFLVGSGEFNHLIYLRNVLHARLALHEDDDFSIITAILSNLHERSRAPHKRTFCFSQRVVTQPFPAAEFKRNKLLCKALAKMHK